jgi:hypothetical protein
MGTPGRKISPASRAVEASWGSRGRSAAHGSTRRCRRDPKSPARVWICLHGPNRSQRSWLLVVASPASPAPLLSSWARIADRPRTEWRLHVGWPLAPVAPAPPAPLSPPLGSLGLDCLSLCVRCRTAGSVVLQSGRR